APAAARRPIFLPTVGSERGVGDHQSSQLLGGFVVGGSGQATIARTSPVPTESPALTRISCAVPDVSALIWFSIFIASSTTSASPVGTVAPTSTRTFTMVPCIGAVTVPLPAPPPPDPPVTAGFGRGRAPPAAPAPARTTGASGSQTLTEYRR